MYADVNGDDLPDINIARLTARDAADLELMINKFMDYERNPPVNPSFYSEPLIAGGWQSDRWFILCCDVVWGFLTNEEGKSPVREYSGYTHGSAPGSWSTNPNTYMIIDYFGPDGLGYIPETPSHLTDWDANAASINNAINSGAFWLLHRDHGYETGWSDPAYNINDLNDLYNDDHVFVLSINCLTGKYDHNPESFAEAFHRMQYGALGLVAASEVSYSFVNDTFVWGMHDSMWPNFDPGYGGGISGDFPLLPGFAQVSGKWYLAASSWPYNPGDKDVTYHLFHMHGDAFTQLCDRVPQDLTVSHENTIDSQATSFEVTADEGSFIGIAMDGIVLGTAEGTGGPVIVEIDPPNHPGIMYVTVTKLNHRRYEAPVMVQTGGPLDLWLPEGAPDRCLPGPSTEVIVMVFDGTETYVSGSGMVHYRFDPSDPYESSPMEELGGGRLSATIPGASPMSQPAFYFSAQGDLGSTVYNPPGAPDSVYTMTVEGLPEIIVQDDFEDDLGWTVEDDPGLTTGTWERGIPVGGGDRGDPPTDYDGSGHCYVTDNRDGDYDIDDGITWLISPSFDLASLANAEVDVAIWYSNNYGNDPNNDLFHIWVSNDNGSNWVLAETIGPVSLSGWTEFEFMLEDYISLTNTVKVRFEASDLNDGSVVEAGIDHFMVSRIIYEASLWADAYSFSASEGCEITFFLDAGPAFAGYEYVLVGGLSGSYPGTQIPGDLTVPINRDWVTEIILDNLNSPVFDNFQGNLDSEGKAVATLVLSGLDSDAVNQTRGFMEPPIVGETGVFAFVLTENWDFVSNPVYIEVEE
jgi:hypothetical protein